MRLALKHDLLLLSLFVPAAVLSCSADGPQPKRDGGVRDAGGAGSGDAAALDAAAGAGGRGGGGAGGLGGRGGMGGLGGMGGMGGVAGAAPDATQDLARPADALLDAGSPASIAPWIAADIGDVGMRKGVTAVQTPTPNESQRIEIMAGGMGVGASRDSFHFAYLALAGDGEILATIPMNGLVTGGDAMARQAGIMFRESLDPDAAMVYVAVVGDGMGGKIVYRTVKGQMASVFPADNAMPPLSAAVRTNNWLRVRRQGNKVRVFAGSRVAATSDAGEIGTGVTLALANPNAPGYFGLAAASKDAMTSLQVRYSGAMVENVFANPATAAYVVHDLGTIGASAIWGANKLKLTGLGQPWGSVAGMYREFFAFAGQPAMGNRELAVRVDSQGNTDPEARAGIVYRLGAITSWSRSGSGASISVTPGKGVQFHQRVLMAGLTTDQTKEWMLSASKEGVRAPVWLRLVRELVPPPPTDPFGSVQTRLTGFYSELDTAGGPRAWTMLGAPVILPASEVVPNGLGVFVNSNNPAAFATAELAWPGAPPPADAGALPDAAAVDVLPAAPDAVSGN